MTGISYPNRSLENVSKSGLILALADGMFLIYVFWVNPFERDQFFVKVVIKIVKSVLYRFNIAQKWYVLGIITIFICEYF